MENSPFFNLLTNFQSTVEVIKLVRDDDPNRDKKLAVLKSRLEQIQTRIDEYGAVVRPRDKNFNLLFVEGNCQQTIQHTESINYLTPEKSFKIYFVGVHENDFPLLLQYKLGAGIINHYNIRSINLSEPFFQ